TKAERDERPAELLWLVGLSPDAAERYPQQFSGGHQQRVALARALAPDPEVLTCGEAPSSLDGSLPAQVLDLLDEAQARVALGSPDLRVLDDMSDAVAAVRQGQGGEHAARHEILPRPQRAYTHELLDAILPGRAAAA